MRGARAAAAAVCALAACGGTAAAGPEHKTTESVRHLRFYAWDESVYGGSGWQLVLPGDLTSSWGLGEGLALDMGLRTAYIWSHNTTEGASGAYEGPTDSNLSLTLTWTKLGRVQPFVSADFNLPTGEETLRGSEKRALMDPDLVWQIRFGEGFNANLGAGASIALAPGLTGTVGAGYNERLAYVPDGDTGAEYDPGGQTTFLLGLQYLDETHLASLTARYFLEERADRNNQPWFDPGDNVEVAGALALALDGRDTVALDLIYSQSARNGYFGLPEQANGNGAVVTGKVAFSRRFGALTAEVNAGGLLRTENDYDAASDFFIPHRTKWDFGAAARGRLWDAIDWTAGLNWGRAEDGDTPYVDPGQEYEHWTGAISAGYAF